MCSDCGRFATDDPSLTEGVLTDVGEERERQETKWGTQHHPDGTKDEQFSRAVRDRAIAECGRKAAMGQVTWKDILMEEVLEAFAEDDIAMLRDELVQVAAVAVAWIEDIESRDHWRLSVV